MHLSLPEKIRQIATNIYRAKDIAFSAEAQTKIDELGKIELYSKFPVCIAKTQYSFSDNASLVNAATDHVLTINEVRLSAGAEFVVCVCGSVMTMPGLPKVPAACSIGLVEGEICGLF